MQSRARQQEATFIVKCTRKCNLRCAYCTDHRATSSEMDVAFLASFFDYLAKDIDLKRVSFVWHGGEPLTLGIGYLRKLYFMQQRILSMKAGVRNTLQTNAVLINDEWAAHFKHYNFTVGVSLDGPADVHDVMRRTADGKESFALCMAGIKTLQRHRVTFGILSVVSERLLSMGPERLMSFFHENKINSYALLSLRRNWSEPNDALEYARAFGAFMAHAAELWFASDNVAVQVRELSSKLDRFFGLPTRICTDAGSCVGHYFCVEPDGGIWHCDKFLGDQRFYLGSVGDVPFSEVRRSKKIAALKRLEADIRRLCRGCKWFRLCRGGCLSSCASFHRNGGRPGTEECSIFTLFECLSRLIAQSPALAHAMQAEKSDLPSIL